MNSMKPDITTTVDTWDSFSQPYGPAALYGAPPYVYRNAQTITIVARVDGALVAPYLPVGLEVDAEPIAVIAASNYPESGFGPYRELSFFIKGTVYGRGFMYSPVMYADSESAIAAGRELWGFAKKSAEMDLAGDDESWHFTARRRGTDIAGIEFRPSGRRTPDEMALVDFPTLTLRLIPPLSGTGFPDVAQLVSTVNVKQPHVSHGEVERWAGSVDVSLDDSSLDPLGAFRPVEVLTAWMTRYDCNLPAGELVHDYRAHQQAD